MLRSIRLSLMVLVTIVIFSSCKKEDPDAVAADDREKIIEYLKKENLFDVAVEDPTGLFYVVEEEGTGANPTLTTYVRIRYVGYYLDEKIFDGNEGALFQLYNTIAGWRIGIPKFKNGGKGKLIVPSALGYGSYPPYGSGIRRNAVLVFDFEIVDMGS